MNEVLHKHLVIKSHNSPMSWEQLCSGAGDELRLWGSRQGSGCQLNSKLSGQEVLGSVSAPRTVALMSTRKEHRNQTFSQKLFSMWMRIVKTEPFLLPQCLPTASVQSWWWPSPAPCPSVGAGGGGTGTPGTAARVLLDLVITEKFMSILAGEWQEVSRQESIGFRHVHEGNDREMFRQSDGHFLTESIPAKGKKKNTEQVCPQTALALCLFTFLSTAVICHWQLYCGDFLSDYFVALLALRQSGIVHITILAFS